MCIGIDDGGLGASTRGRVEEINIVKPMNNMMQVSRPCIQNACRHVSFGRGRELKMYHAFPRQYVGYGSTDGVDFTADSIAGDQLGIHVEGVGEQTAAPAGWQLGRMGRYSAARTHLRREGVAT